jgi:cytochrome c oxidase subunit 2
MALRGTALATGRASDRSPLVEPRRASVLDIDRNTETSISQAYGMRFLATLLLIALLVLGVWTFMDADKHGWWLPPIASSYGKQVDDLFDLILYMVAFFFVLTEGILIYCVFAYSKKRHDKATFTHGNHKLEMVWTIIPALLLLVIAFSQMKTWADIKFEGNMPNQEPIAEVYASQFDWRVKYPGADGKFGTMDDIENPFEFVVPVNEKVKFILRSRDVIHSFFVPYFRLKQDAVPGMAIPVWFQATHEGNYDLVCAELCGWGHYKMAGRIKVVSRPAFDEWMKKMQKDLVSNGKEDKS